MSTKPAPKAAPAKRFPLKDYFAHLGYLGLLLSSCIAILPRTTAYFYPAAIEAALAARSSADRPEPAWLTPLTASAAGSTAWVAAGTAVTMAWWGGKMAKWAGASLPSDKRVSDAALATGLTTLVLDVWLHLLGAGLSQWFRTLLLALTLALLTAWPIIYALGIPSMHDDGIVARYRLTRLVCAWRAEDAAERAFAYPLAGSLIGAWVGAVPIALDWDRPWQTYPLTPVVGALMGFLAGGYTAWMRSAYTSLRADVVAEQRSDAAAAAAAAKASGRKRKGGKAK